MANTHLDFRAMHGIMPGSNTAGLWGIVTMSSTPGPIDMSDVQKGLIARRPGALPQSDRSSLAKHMLDMRPKNAASDFQGELVRMAREFDSGLDNQHEVGFMLCNFGQVFTIHLEAIGHFDPSLIIFIGTTEQGEPVKLVQHVSQISVLFVKMKRLNPEKPKVGFRAE